MKPQVKLGLYVATVLGTLVFGALFVKNWRASDASAGVAAAAAAKAESSAPAKAKPAKPAKASKTAKKPDSAAGTNAAVAAATNAVDAATNEVATASTETNETSTATAAATADPSAADVPAEREGVPLRNATVNSRHLGSMILYGLLGVASLAGLGFLIAFDVAQYAGRRATEVLFDDRGGDVGDTEYEAIEKVYGSGDYLETVRLLREFLRSNPKALHAQIRIAEIYEKDLNNPLASALEYEEVLKLPLEPTRWGWTAIHLVNLYNRLDRTPHAVALMQRILVECPDTPAAGKARERLVAMGEDASGPPPPPSSSGGDGGLPPGFRPKR